MKLQLSCIIFSGRTIHVSMKRRVCNEGTIEHGMRKHEVEDRMKKKCRDGSRMTAEICLNRRKK
jgi:hypothetical protein